MDMKVFYSHLNGKSFSGIPVKFKNINLNASRIQLVSATHRLVKRGKLR
jgi:hypothetical protein